MTNIDILNQLRFRKRRVGELIAMQNSQDAKNLLSAEEWYVDAMIEYRERHGGMEGVILKEPNDTPLAPES